MSCYLYMQVFTKLKMLLLYELKNFNKKNFKIFFQRQKKLKAEILIINTRLKLEVAI